MMTFINAKVNGLGKKKMMLMAIKGKSICSEAIALCEPIETQVLHREMQGLNSYFGNNKISSKRKWNEKCSVVDFLMTSACSAFKWIALQRVAFYNDDALMLLLALTQPSLLFLSRSFLLHGWWHEHGGNWSPF